jgi:hypothetical protein
MIWGRKNWGLPNSNGWTRGCKYKCLVTQIRSTRGLDDWMSRLFSELVPLLTR